MADLVVKVGQTQNTSVQKITSKTQLVDILKAQLATRPRQAIKGLMRIYANQTESEQTSGGVIVNNGIGFVHVDSEILTSFAKQYEKKGSLSEKQMAILYKKMPKYAGQLINSAIAEGKIFKEGREYKFKK
jgi:hypothetical protein